MSRAFRLAALLAWVSTGAVAAPVDAYPDIASAYWVEIDGRPAWAGHADQVLPVASLAKLMAALVLDEEADLAATVTTSRAASAATGTRLGLRAGDQFSASDLFTAMLVRSANDACRALADWHGGGTDAAFVERMNARAAELGMHSTRFANACGHDAPGQGSTARDLALLARAVMARPRIMEHARRERFDFASLAGRRFSVRSTNALLGQFPGAIGLKTGFTPGAGRCLVALAERDGHQVLAILLHAPDRWWDTVGVLELAFDQARRDATPAR
ncbi:D-alanyl-D-alanine carboxypeptidase family protein [Arenimonas donghaensis]|uniref:Peptidase S11 D-alanyl-D-alanine carboxypeptidase A N-terminal domain-containing protein n=1 Tax=Arenimonas donghaensis DSM 18148 = HO3-R19 TaxID=1121014 RepID=A0A087MKG2_9GAMM|nr:serine hydrolase [Arenimonas donghaensis]KFL37365.1 hypothetical protein N788_10215 [Arenimonas donghaensis DSM 18148 = HO3-R19]